MTYKLKRHVENCTHQHNTVSYDNATGLVLAYVSSVKSKKKCYDLYPSLTLMLSIKMDELKTGVSLFTI